MARLQSGPHCFGADQRKHRWLIQQFDLVQPNAARLLAAAFQPLVRIGQPRALEENEFTQRGNNAMEKNTSEPRSAGAKPMASAL
jgi:hypothetical protein